jgi:plasmid stabilization system protein ParE
MAQTDLAPAKRWFNGLFAALQSLEDLPERCPIAPEAATHGLNVRQLLYGRSPMVYRILYAVEGDSVYILHIRHAARRSLDESELVAYLPD